MSVFVVVAAVVALLAGLFWRLARMSGDGLMLVGAAVALGLAGYALQGAPSAPARLAEEASSDSRTAARTDARDTRPRRALPEAQALAEAEAQIQRGAADLAIRTLKEGLKATPGSAALWTGLGNAFVAHERGLLAPPAEYAYKRALALWPGYADALYYYGLALAANDRRAEARAPFVELLKLVPADAPQRGQVLQDAVGVGALTPAEAAKL
jgi:cytochrome c-type biogenesis protein CcmH